VTVHREKTKILLILGWGDGRVERPSLWRKKKFVEKSDGRGVHSGKKSSETWGKASTYSQGNLQEKFPATILNAHAKGKKN